MEIPGLEIVFPPDPHMVVLCLVGRMPPEAIPRAEEVCLGVVDKGRPWVVIDLTRAAHVSEIGVGMLAYFQGYLRSKGGKLAVVAPPPEVMAAIERFNLPGIIPWCPSREAAFAALRQARTERAGAKGR